MNFDRDPFRFFCAPLALAALLAAPGCDKGSDTGDTMGTATTGPTTASASDTEDPSTTTADASTGASDSNSGGSTSMDTSETGMTDLSHDADIQPIWDMYCTLPACHDGATFPPDLTEGNAYAAIVSVASSQSDLNFVEPGSADDSYLWHKVNGTQVEAGGNGLAMPYDGTEVSATDLAAIEEWINGGAPQ